MKDKDKIASSWQIKDEFQKIDKNRFRFGSKEKGILVTSVKERDPYIRGRLEFWHWLSEKNSDIAYPLLKNKEGDFILESGNNCYFATREFKEKPLDFGNDETLKSMAITLGRFHKLAREFDWSESCLPQKKPMRYLNRMEKLMIDAESCFIKAKKAQFYKDNLIKRSEESFFLLCTGALDSLKDGLMEKGDFVYGKINGSTLMRSEKKVKLTDFSHMSEDLAILDLCQLFRRYLKDSPESGDKIWRALKLYEAENPLNAMEKKALMGFLLFPYNPCKSALCDKKKNNLSKIIAKEEKREKLYTEIYKRGLEAKNEDCH